MTTKKKTGLGEFESLKFPHELGTDEVPNFIRFVPKKFKFGATRTGNEATSVANPGNMPAPENVGDNSNGGLFDPSDIMDGITGSVSNVANTVMDSLNKQSFDINVPLADTFSLGGKYKLDLSSLTGKVETDPDTVQPQGSINLFMPNELAANLSLDYGATQITGAGLRVAQKGATQDELKELIKTATAEAVRGFFSDNPLVVAADLNKGRAINNFSYQTFSGVSHREFSYVFKMVPRNEQDSKVIRHICNTFKYWSLPRRMSQAEILYFEIPCLWEINYYRKGKVIEFLDSPNDCFLTGVEVTYGENTDVTLYDDGAPLEVSLSLNFVEVDTLHRGD